jgi:hypothetical protein
MAMFYLLPPRPVLEDRLKDAIGRFLPGLNWSLPGGDRLTDLFLDAISPVAGIYLVCRDELPAGGTTEQALMDGFGAAPGDEIVEVSLGGRPGEVHSCRWRIPETRQSPLAA